MTALVDPRVYGATGNGVDDDATAIKAAVADVIAAGGGVVDLSSLAAPKLLSVLDLSGLKGRNIPLELRGAGVGNTTGSGGSQGATIIQNGTGGTAIKATGSVAQNAPIIGITLQGFMVRNLGNLGATPYTIDLDYCVASCSLRDVFVDGGGFTGNGIAFRNMAKGQSVWENVTARHLSPSSSVGFRISSETTSDNAAVNSGNSSFISCTAEECYRGWIITGPGNLLNGLTLISPKAVNTSDVAGAIGFYFLTNVHACTVVAPHAERFSTGYRLASVRHLAILNPLANMAGGTPDAASAGVRMDGTTFGCAVESARITETHYGVSFEGSARMNRASGADVSTARVLTSFFNDTSTDKSNATEYLDATPNGVLNLAGRAVRIGQSVTASRPSASAVGAGAQWYDTTLGKPVWSNGTDWKDAAGNTV